MNAEYADKGLVVMGLSDEDPQKVSDYLDQMGITVLVASGSHSSGEYGVKGIPASCLIGTDGKVAWFGSPYELTKGTVEDALKGAKARSTNFLALSPKTETPASLAAIVKSMEQGKLAKALQALNAMTAADSKSADADKTAAQALVADIEAHVTALKTQAEAFVKSRDVLKAVTVYDALAKEFGALEYGTASKARVDEIKKDAALSKELQAAEALEKLRDSVAKLASSKAKDKYKDFADKWKGTKAGDRARAMSTKKD